MTSFDMNDFKSSGYLCNAARQKQLIVDANSAMSDCWTNLKFMILLHGTKGILYDDRPTASDQHYKQFFWAGEHSISNFARQRRPTPAKLTDQGMVLERLAPVSQTTPFMLQDRQAYGANDLGMDDVESILTKVQASTSDIRPLNVADSSKEGATEGMFNFCAKVLDCFLYFYL